jgi:hypothetical protein
MNTYRASSMIVSVAIVAYLLSPGPIVSYYQSRGVILPAGVQAFLAPLSLACDEIPMVRKGYTLYLNLWD